MTGTIKKKVEDRGFGFIAKEDGSELFFHTSSVVGTTFEDLKVGDSVTFDEVEGKKGPAAANVAKA